jgi:hypothetical protein
MESKRGVRVPPFLDSVSSQLLKSWGGTLNLISPVSLFFFVPIPSSFSASSKIFLLFGSAFPNSFLASRILAKAKVSFFFLLSSMIFADILSKMSVRYSNNSHCQVLLFPGLHCLVLFNSGFALSSAFNLFGALSGAFHDCKFVSYARIAL